MTIEPTGDDALYAHVTFQSGAIGHFDNDHAGRGQRFATRQVYGSKGRLECPGDRNGRPLKLSLDDGSTIDDERILEYAPSYRLSPVAADLWGKDRVWTYSLDFNETDSRILALESYELGECIKNGTQPEVSGEEGRAVTLDEMITASADAYQREIDEHLGLI